LSGSSARAYCEERKLKVSSLRYWSGRIGRDDGGEVGVAEEAFADAPTAFAKIRRRKEKAVDEPKSGSIRLLVGEVAVEVPVGFDAETLRRLLEVLGGGS